MNFGLLNQNPSFFGGDQFQPPSIFGNALNAPPAAQPSQTLAARLFGGGLMGEDVGLSSEIQKRAQQQAMLQAGLAMMANSGRRVGPRRGLGEILSGGLQAGQQGYQGALRSGVAGQEYKEKRDAKVAAQQASQGVDWNSQESIQSYGQKLMQLGRMDEAKVAFDRADTLAKKNEPFTMSEGQVRFGADGQPIASVPKGSALEAKMKELRAAGVDPSSPQGQKYLGMYVDRDSNGASPYFQAVPTPDGYMRFNARTGQMEPINVNGKVPTPIAADTGLKFDMSRAGAEGKATGEAVSDARLNLEGMLAKADQALKVIDDTLAAPGLNIAIGTSGTFDPRNYIPGTSAKDAQVRIEQIQGKAFLEAFETLKGGGQITEREGQAATAAMARLNRAQSDREFRASLNELRDVIVAGKARAQQRAQGVAAPQQPQRGGIKFLGFE